MDAAAVLAVATHTDAAVALALHTITGGAAANYTSYAAVASHADAVVADASHAVTHTLISNGKCICIAGNISDGSLVKIDIHDISPFNSIRLYILLSAITASQRAEQNCLFSFMV